MRGVRRTQARRGACTCRRRWTPTAWARGTATRAGARAPGSQRLRAPAPWRARLGAGPGARTRRRCRTTACAVCAGTWLRRWSVCTPGSCTRRLRRVRARRRPARLRLRPRWRPLRGSTTPGGSAGLARRPAAACRLGSSSGRRRPAWFCLCRATARRGRRCARAGARARARPARLRGRAPGAAGRCLPRWRGRRPSGQRRRPLPAGRGAPQRTPRGCRCGAAGRCPGTCCPRPRARACRPAPPRGFGPGSCTRRCRR